MNLLNKNKNKASKMLLDLLLLSAIDYRFSIVFVVYLDIVSY